MQFLIEQGVTKGTARRFIRDIHEWVEHVRCDPSPEANTDDISEDIIVLSDHSAEAE
ncbi:hypothetical protein BDV06DRAFT_208288 [Aspergillus oleicola]